MGDTEDDITEGFTCSYCGVYFEEEHGFPVLCHKCFVKQGKDIKAGKIKSIDRIPHADHPELGTTKVKPKPTPPKVEPEQEATEVELEGYGGWPYPW